MLNTPTRLHQNTVLCQDPHPQSRAAYVKLSRYLYELQRKCYWEVRAIFIRKSKHIAKCFYCYKDLSKKSKSKSNGITIDHFKPISLGANPLDTKNFRICCNECNQSRSHISQAPENDKRRLYSEYLKKTKVLHHSFMKYL